MDGQGGFDGGDLFQFVVAGGVLEQGAGQVIAAHYEDPPLFSSEVVPSTGQGIRQAIGPIFELMSRYLGPQWSVGDWDGLSNAMKTALPPPLQLIGAAFGAGDAPPQNLKEYDPEWGRAFWSGTVGASCDHERMLRSVKVRHVLLTHHFRVVDETSGTLMGALADLQANRVMELLRGAGVHVEYRSFPTVGHSMHGTQPDLFVDTLLEWVRTLEL